MTSKTTCPQCKRVFSSRSVVLIHGTLACRDCQNRLSKGLPIKKRRKNGNNI